MFLIAYAFKGQVCVYSHMFLIAYALKGQVRVFAGQVKIVSHSSCRTSAILKYFFPSDGIPERIFQKS